jgi:hypothetical protein
MIVPPQVGFSASVSLTLIVNGQPVEVAQLGPRSIILREPAQAIAQQPATLVVRVGDNQKTQQVILGAVSRDNPCEVLYW